MVSNLLETRKLDKVVLVISNEIDFNELLSKYRSDPYGYIDVRAIQQQWSPSQDH